MHNTLFTGIFETGALDIAAFIECIAASIIIGLFISFVHGFKNPSSKSFLITLALLPAIVCVVIMMVNGNVGAGVAVAGAFSLVRFRSAPGNAKEITAIFLAMGTGIITGMGYIGYAALFAIIIGAVMVILNGCGFGENGGNGKSLRITIPEDLNYTDVFDDIFKEYTKSHEVVSVKTTNMGSLFKLSYDIELKDSSKEKEFIDALRTKNGNLEISISRKEMTGYEL